LNYWILIPILIAQQFSGVLVNRAVNSNSILYGAISSIVSNITYFVGQIIMVNQFMGIIREGNTEHAAALGAVYVTTMTLTTSFSQWACMRWFEKRKK